MEKHFHYCIHEEEEIIEFFYPLSKRSSINHYQETHFAEVKFRIDQIRIDKYLSYEIDRYICRFSYGPFSLNPNNKEKYNHRHSDYQISMLKKLKIILMEKYPQYFI